LFSKIKRFNHIFLFLDYDGTLVGFKKNPEDAVPSIKVKKLISGLANIPKIVLTIVSGRTIYSLLGFFQDLKTETINWSGVHGGQIKYAGSEISMPAKIKNALPGIASLKEKVTKIINNIPCYTIEDKGLSFALHYRRCGDKDLAHLRKINSILFDYVKGRPVELMQMKKVVEVKPKGINKGDAVGTINRKYKKNISSLNICLGDDATDEYLFKSNASGINIKVGESEYLDSKAEYYLKDIKEVHKFLGMLYNVLK